MRAQLVEHVFARGEPAQSLHAPVQINAGRDLDMIWNDGHAPLTELRSDVEGQVARRKQSISSDTDDLVWRTHDRFVYSRTNGACAMRSLDKICCAPKSPFAAERNACHCAIRIVPGALMIPFLQLS